MQKPWETQFWLDDSPGTTLHAQLLNKLTSDIQNGRLSPGSMLPGSRALASQLSINRKTVQQVYEELESQGWLETRPRKGTFISEVLPEGGLNDEYQNLIGNYKIRNQPEVVGALYRDTLNILSGTQTNDGTPDSRLIPYELIGRSYRKACISLSRNSDLGYGDPRGTAVLRNSVQRMLSEERFMNCTKDNICIVRGSQMGIYLSSRILDPSKGAIVMEELCYLPARAAFRSNRFETLNCRLDENGINTDHLEEILQTQSIAGVYITPHHQYPTTATLTMERRLKLLELSRQYEFAIIEDDYDHEFHYGKNPIPPIASLPGSENVIHIGSMSKVFAPGLRLGYMAASQKLIEKVAQEIMIIDRQGNTISEYVLSDLMESGEVRRHIRKTKKEYESRRDFAASEFHRVFGSKVSFNLPVGGMAIWVDISKLLQGRPANTLNTEDATLSTLYTDSQASPTHLRFGFGAINEKEITRAIEKLATALGAE